MNRCTNCEAEVPAGTTSCPNCGASLGPAQPTRFGSRAADGWFSGIVTFLLCAVVLALGFALSGSATWTLLASFVVAFLGGVLALALTWNKYPTVRMGILIGLSLALLNPFSLCIGLISIITIAS
jgi:hypothetical protein